MVTLVVFLLISSVSFFPNLAADILNILNASAMEAIVGIVIVFLYHGKWKTRPTNNVQVLESGNIFAVFGINYAYDTSIKTLPIFENSTNIALIITILFIFFALFTQYSKFFGITAILLLSEAAMVTLVVFLLLAAATFFPNLGADLLNILNASAMEAIVGIVIVFLYHGKWKTRPANKTQVLEAGLPGVKTKKQNVNCNRMGFLAYKKLKIWKFILGLELLPIFIKIIKAAALYLCCSYLVYYLFVEQVFTAVGYWDLRTTSYFVPNGINTVRPELGPKPTTQELWPNAVIYREIIKNSIQTLWWSGTQNTIKDLPYTNIGRVSQNNVTSQLENYFLSPNNAMHILATISANDVSWKFKDTNSIDTGWFQTYKISNPRAIAKEIQNVAAIFNTVEVSDANRLINNSKNLDQKKPGILSLLDKLVFKLEADFKGSLLNDQVQYPILKLNTFEPNSFKLDFNRSYPDLKPLKENNLNFFLKNLVFYNQPHMGDHIKFKRIGTPLFAATTYNNFKLQELGSIWFPKTNQDILDGIAALDEVFNVFLNKLTGVRKLIVNSRVPVGEFNNNVKMHNSDLGTRYARPYDELGWSNKNVDALLSHYSRVLPWYEGFDTDDEVLDSSEKINMQNSIDQTELLKLGWLPDKTSAWSDNVVRAFENIEIKPKSPTTNQYVGYDRGEIVTYSVGGVNLEHQERELSEISLLLEKHVNQEQFTIRRAQIASEFPTSSNRGLNIIGTDREDVLSGLSYSKGSSESGLIESNLLGDFSRLSRVQLYGSGMADEIKTGRLFSYSMGQVGELGLGKILELSGNLSKSRVKKKNTTVMHMLDDGNYISRYRKNRQRRYFKNYNNTSLNMVKLLNDGNLEKLNIITSNRVLDLESSKKQVKDRMLLPVKNVINDRAEELLIAIPKTFETPKENILTKLVGYNDKLADTKVLLPKLRETVGFNLVNFDNLLFENKKQGERATIHEDFEPNSDYLRADNVKPHTLYGILWDEYLKQAFNVNLQFMNFNADFKSKFKSNLDQNSRLLGDGYKKHLQHSLSPDFRYKFTINDEIKNTLIGKSLAQIGYVSDLENPEYRVKQIGVEKKKSILRTLRTKIIENRTNRKKLRIWIRRQKKFTENPIGLKYDQTPHLLKLPYIKKQYWVHNYENYLPTNNILTNFNYLSAKNTNIWSKSRYTTSMPVFENEEVDSIDYVDNESLDYSLELYIPKEEISYSEDNFFIGTESSAEILGNRNYINGELLRIAKFGSLNYGTNNLAKLWDNSKVGIWASQKKKRMYRKQTFRGFMNRGLKNNDIFYTKGLIKYSNFDKFKDLSTQVQLFSQRTNRAFENVEEFDNPIAEGLRYGSFEMHQTLRNHNVSSGLRYIKLGNTEFSGELGLPELSHILKKEILDKSLLLTSLYNDPGSSRFKNNQIRNLDFYMEAHNQGKNTNYLPEIYNYPEESIIVGGLGEEKLFADNWYNSYGEFSVLDSISLSESSIFLKKQELRDLSAGGDFTRNRYTYFSENPWETSGTTYSGQTYPYFKDSSSCLQIKETGNFGTSVKFSKLLINLYRDTLEIYLPKLLETLFPPKLEDYFMGGRYFLEQKIRTLYVISIKSKDVYYHILTACIFKILI